ncbi:MAG: Mov34/MPN/PAD-1 family protein [Planctomycetes bacterium]|nr:Mov34/MPN/PAD-1 family protein [Planctomycetota bacterium]
MPDIEVVGEVGELEIAEPPEKLIPTLDRSRRVEAMGTIQGDDLHIFLREETLREIVIYAKSNMSRELGGVLIGRFYRWDKKLWIEVAGYIKAQNYVNTAASFKFTHDSWSAITREKEKRFNDMPIVGWQHTHPGYGIFLSHLDQFIQRHFFNLPHQVALVVDPRADELGFFQWKHRAVTPCGFFYVYDASSR